MCVSFIFLYIYHLTQHREVFIRVFLHYLFSPMHTQRLVTCFKKASVLQSLVLYDYTYRSDSQCLIRTIIIAGRIPSLTRNSLLIKKTPKFQSRHHVFQRRTILKSAAVNSKCLSIKLHICF